MEERMIDDEEARGIKLKRTQSGETDAVEEGTDEQEEYVFDVPEEEYDESLVGLTPSQLEQVLEERLGLNSRAISSRGKPRSKRDCTRRRRNFSPRRTDTFL